ncbi:hypothetical protein B6U74_07060, partial [Candidatus Bathyarchaeota archaeon ex4484_205]
TGTQCWDVHSCHYPLELKGIEEEVYRAILRVQMRHKDLAPVSAVLIECTKRGIKSYNTCVGWEGNVVFQRQERDG